MPSLEELEAAVSALSQFEPLFAPHAIASFEVLSALESEGAIKSFRVRDRRASREARLRLVSAESSQAEALMAEAALRARLDHPGIPTIFEVGRTANGEVFVLDRPSEGPTLAEILRSSSSEPYSDAARRRVLLSLSKLAQTLAHAHGQGLIHSDLRPEKVRIAAYGEVLLEGWEQARDLRKPKSGQPSDSAPLCPEQLRGEALDQASDVYALGRLVYQAWTAEAPALGLELAELDRRSLPGPVIWLLEQALEPEPSERSTAEDLAAQLEAVLADDWPPGYRPGLAERTRRFARRNPAGLLAALLALGLLSLSAQLYAVSRLAKDRARELELTRLAEEAARDQAARSAAMLEAFQAARDLAERGLTLDSLKKVDEALALTTRGPDELLQAGMILLTAGAKREAAELFNEAAEKHPPAYEALYQLHLLELGSRPFLWTRSLNELHDRALVRGDVNEFTLFAQALDKHRKGQLEESLKIILEARARNPRLATLAIHQGNLCADLKRWEEALRCYAEALETEPRNSLIFSNRASARTAINQLDLAIEDCNEAMRLDDKNANAYYNRGVILEQRGQLREAEADYDQAIARDDRDASAFANRAGLRVRRGAMEEARRDYDQAVALSPKSAIIRTNRGAFRRRRNDVEGALNDYEAALEIDPLCAPAHFNRANLLESMNRSEEALAGFGKTIELAPEYLQARLARAAILMKRNDFEAAREDLDSVLKAEPDNISALSTRGLINAQSSRFEEAEADLSRALELQPSLIDTRTNRGRVRMHLRRDSEARVDLERALEQAPDGPNATKIRIWLRELEARARER